MIDDSEDFPDGLYLLGPGVADFVAEAEDLFCVLDLLSLRIDDFFLLWLFLLWSWSGSLGSRSSLASLRTCLTSFLCLTCGSHLFHHGCLELSWSHGLGSRIGGSGLLLLDLLFLGCSGSALWITRRLACLDFTLLNLLVLRGQQLLKILCNL